MEDVLIIVKNNDKDIYFLKRLEKQLQDNFSVSTLVVNDCEKDSLISLEKKLKNIKNNDNYYVIVNDNSISFLLKCIDEKKISPKLYISVGIDEKDVYCLSMIKKIQQRCEAIIIQQQEDDIKNIEELNQFFDYTIPIIPVDKSDEKSCNYMEYIYSYLNTNVSNFQSKKVIASNIRSAINKVDIDRIKYKYINNWLFDPNNRILCFNYNKRNYILKRVTKQKADIEIKNAELLKKYLDNLLIDDYRIRIIIPAFYKINDNYGYLFSELYGRDFNQYYYNDEKDSLMSLENVFYKVKDILHYNKMYYNGFIPRNLILNDKEIYIIDFEDLNKKSENIINTTQVISWSYFVDFNILGICKNMSHYENLKFDKELEEILSNFPNIYQVAIIAESSYNSVRKIDDVINIISEYIIYEVELILDIIMYDYSMHNILCNFEDMLYSLSKKIKILASFYEYDKLKKIVNVDLNNILLKLQNTEISDNLNEAIEYAKRKILIKV